MGNSAFSVPAFSLDNKNNENGGEEEEEQKKQQEQKKEDQVANEKKEVINQDPQPENQEQVQAQNIHDDDHGQWEDVHDDENLEEELRRLQEEMGNHDEEGEDEEELEDEEEEGEEEKSDPTHQSQAAAPIEASTMPYGCQHYRRAAMKRCEECKEFFTCRFCHDDAKYLNERDVKKAHQYNRFATKEVKCMKCEHIQPISQSCLKCGIEFAGYFCEVCKLLDDDYKKKKIFHCDKCGICRVGGREATFHCDGCGCCMNITLQGNHECKGERLNDDCAVCMDKLFTSRDPAVFLKCGHAMHSKCNKSYVKTNMNCPICRKSIMDPRLIEAHIDNVIAQQPMPEEYSNIQAQILCNDCMKKSTVKFHFIGMKCPDCRSYNTQQINEK